MPPPVGQVVVGQIPRRPRCFVDRTELAELRSVLNGEPVVVTGMRGVGKTQLAAALARDDIDSGTELVGWVDAETLETACAGLAEIAERLGVADPEGDSAVSARRLRDCLAGRRQAGLLVFDNVVDPDAIRPLLPIAGGTRVLITSTNRDCDALGRSVDLGSYTRQQSVHYLTQATGRPDVADAGLVAAALGDLPLALSCAAATITGRRLDYARYRDLLGQRTLPEVLERKAGHEYPRSVVQAILLSVDAVEARTGRDDRDDPVLWLLAAMSMLSPAGVRRSILPDLDGRLDEALERCVTGSLLSWSADGDAVIMHRLVARVFRERAQSDGVAGDFVFAGLAVVGPLLTDGREVWARRYEGFHVVDQIHAIWNTGLPETMDGALLAQLFATRAWAVVQLTEAADFARALIAAHDTVIDCGRILGPDHPDTLISRSNLARVHESAGRLDKAIPLYEAVLADCERVHGPDHPGTLITRHNLAVAYTTAQLFDKAIPLYQAILTDYERVLGHGHPNIHLARIHLANAYGAANRPDEAIPLCETTLAEHEQALGAMHPDTLSARHALAAAYASAGRFDEAIPLFETTLADSEQVLGADHPDTLSASSDLADVYHSVGRFEPAIGILEPTLTTYEQVLGPDHPRTLIAHNNLAAAYQSVGQLERATRIHETTLASRERVLGPDHPHTLISRNNLAGAYAVAGEFDRAIPLLESAFAARERVLGPRHPATLLARNNLAELYQSAGQLARAISFLENTLSDYTQLFGPDNPHVLIARNNLAAAYHSSGRFDEAIKLFETMLAAFERTQGPDHPITAAARRNLIQLRESKFE
ncbi:tetratricopeptide repeat protein [Nocardia colli]|uniref:Tetratricopeptide repeat protein n=1 Tax=Nocardia colli TaxID=2545717 RepID=A0A5N0EI80_9NOCA|nr:tetratricopeptide repeat protein [Nocardia colli]KAA8889002.1 tetratricopeptide repeat protein [Nocardia colli]